MGAQAPVADTCTTRTVMVRLLGRFTVTVDGRTVDTSSSRRTRNVLAYLLAHRRTPVARDVLMDAFWPRAAPEAARNSVHVALTGVRAALRAAAGDLPLVERWHDTYRIADGVQVWVDVEDFAEACRLGRRAEREGRPEEARRAYELADQLYEGDFLADDPFAEWAAAHRESLRLQLLDAQSRLLDLYLAAHDVGAAALLARRVLAADPCNEPVHRRLMACYARAGQVHLALAQYQRCAETLWTQLRVRPTAETSALYRRLREPCRT